MTRGILEGRWGKLHSNEKYTRRTKYNSSNETAIVQVLVTIMSRENSKYIGYNSVTETVSHVTVTGRRVTLY